MKKLFESVKIRNKVIKNRVTVPPMVINFSSNDAGVVSSHHINHYESIAKGGAGLIIQEATCVNPHGRLADYQLGIWQDSQIDGLKKITKAVHKYNVPILVQIHHAGVMGIEKVNLSASNYIFDFRQQHKVAREAAVNEIHQLQQDFIQAAIRAYQAGYDGVEIHGCHNYLISQFLNRRVNQRQDIYGMHPEQFVIEIIEGIRNQTPADFIIGIRMGGFEPTLQDSINYAKRFEDVGIDFLDISYGFTPEFEVNMPQNYPFKDIIYAVAQIKKEVDIPVFAVNGINNPNLAEEILTATKVDMVDIGRGTLVNYNWSNDAKEGKNVGTCINCKVCLWSIDPTKCPSKIKHEKTKNKPV